MRLESYKPLLISAVISAGIILASFVANLPTVFADNGDATEEYEEISDFHHVTIYDGATRLSVRTDAFTVAELLDRAHITISDSDKVEPSLDAEINVDNFFVNIYRSRPAVVIDGDHKTFLMTYSYDPLTVARDAGLEVYDDDVVRSVIGGDFLEYGTTSAYVIERGEGSLLTVEEEIPFSDVTNYDYSLAYGKSEVIQLGEIGAKTSTYQIQRIDGVEVSRTLVSETVIRPAVDRITRIGANTSGSTSPTENENIAWTYLRGQGFTREQTAGIMGNLMQEHHFSTSDGGGGLGIAQWTGGRRNNLLSRENPYEIFTQLDYLMSELNGPYIAIKNDLLAATTIDDATIIFQNRFERCGVCREDMRLSYAYDIYSRHQD